MDDIRVLFYCDSQFPCLTVRQKHSLIKECFKKYVDDLEECVKIATLVKNSKLAWTKEKP